MPTSRLSNTKKTGIKVMIENQLLETIVNSDKVVGMKQVLKGIENSTIKCVIVADDADDFIKNQVVACANQYKVKIENVSSKEALGKVCNIDVGAAVVGLK
ncbi:MAG: ribosomal L7Ae/L30e/S12e/Gadd45 family protein [Clostridia bacterium]